MTECRAALRHIGTIVAVSLTIGGGLRSGLHAQVSPYAGMEERRIKALSEEERAAYLRGDGMGLALAAELNGLAGPKHVLELADSLELTADQRSRTAAAFDAMHTEAVRLGTAIVDAEERLDEALRSGTIDTTALAALTTEIGLLQGSLRFTHLSAHLAMRAILTEAQVTRYRALRGYTDAAAHDHRHHQ